MQTETDFTMLTAMGEITREVVEAVADRPGDSPSRRVARQQTAFATISSFLPGDPVQTMLVGQCVMFDHLLRDGARDTLRGQQQDMKLRARPQILATAKMFVAHLDRLERMKSRLADRLAVQPPIGQAATETSAPRDQGAATDTRPTTHVELAETAAAATGTPPNATAATRSNGPETLQSEGRVGAPKTTGTPATTAAATPASRQPAAAQTTADPPQTAITSPSSGPGVIHARSNTPPDQPKPGTQPSSPSQPARDQSQQQRNQAPGVGHPGDAVALLAASLAVSPSPQPGGQTTKGELPPAPARSVSVDEPV